MLIEKDLPSGGFLCPTDWHCIRGSSGFRISAALVLTALTPSFSISFSYSFGLVATWQAASRDKELPDMVTKSISSGVAVSRMPLAFWMFLTDDSVMAAACSM
jgi:hypothetical protein